MLENIPLSQPRLQKMLLQTQNLIVTFSEALLELGHLKTIPFRLYYYHNPTASYQNSFSQNFSPCISSKVNQVGLDTFFTN